METIRPVVVATEMPERPGSGMQRKRREDTQAPRTSIHHDNIETTRTSSLLLVKTFRPADFSDGPIPTVPLTCLLQSPEMHMGSLFTIQPNAPP